MSTERGLTGRGRRSRGFALLIVLWAIVLAALIGTQITALGRRETRIAANLRGAAVAEAAADGAVYEAIFRLMRNEVGWDADGTPHALTVGDVAVSVKVVNEDGKVNLNDASAPLLAAVMQILGVDGTQAQGVAAAIVAWRGNGDDNTAALDSWRQRYQSAGLGYVPPFDTFQSLDELALVLGVTPDIYALLEPHITIYSSGTIDPNAADTVVAAALKALPANDQSDNSGTPKQGPQSVRAVSIDAQAATSDGAAFARHAVVRLGTGTNGYTIMVWDRGHG